MTSRHPLSAGQEALWLLNIFAKDTSVFHGVVALRLYGALDLDVLADAIADTARRHEMLRSTYEEGDDGPVRVEHPGMKPPLEIQELPGGTDEQLRVAVDEFAVRPFDLGAEPPFRFLVVRPDPGSVVCTVVGHHIAMDAGSQIIVMHDVLTFYSGRISGTDPAVVPLRKSFDDFVALEQEQINPAEGLRPEEYWRRTLTPLPPSAHLPADHPRPSKMDQSRATWELMLPEELASTVDDAARRAGVTTFVYLFGLFQVALYRWSRQPDFVLGYTVSARVKFGYRWLVGLLANTPPYRARLRPDMTLREALAATDEQIAEAMPYMTFPYALMPHVLKAPRQVDRAPLFEVSFNHLANRHLGQGKTNDELGNGAAEVGGLLVRPFQTTRLWLGNQDLSAEVLQIGTDALLVLMYRDTLYDPATIERFGRDYVDLLEAAGKSLDEPVAAGPEPV